MQSPGGHNWHESEMSTPYGEFIHIKEIEMFRWSNAVLEYSGEDKPLPPLLPTGHTKPGPKVTPVRKCQLVTLMRPQ